MEYHGAFVHTMPFFSYGGGRGGVKSWRRQALFQGRHCFCPTPTLGGGGGSSQGGRHPLTALSTVPTQYQTTRNASSREGLTTAC